MTLFPPAKNQTDYPSRNMGYALSAFSSISTAGLITMARLVLSDGDPVFLGGLVMFAAGFILFAIAFFRHGFRWLKIISPIGWLYTALFTGLSLLALIAFWTGISMLEASKVGFLQRIQTIVILILGTAFLKEKFTIFEMLAGIFVIAGAVIIKWSMDVEMSLGFWIMLASAILFGLVEIAAKLAVHHVEPYRFNSIRNLVVGTLMILSGCLRGTAEWNLGMRWYGIAAMAFLGPLVARTIYLYSLRLAEVSKIALVTQIQPVFIVILAVVFLKEYPGLQELIGGALIVIGCAGVVFLRPEVVKKTM